MKGREVYAYRKEAIIRRLCSQNIIVSFRYSVNWMRHGIVIVSRYEPLHVLVFRGIFHFVYLSWLSQL